MRSSKILRVKLLEEEVGDWKGDLERQRPCVEPIQGEKLSQGTERAKISLK